MKIKPLGIKVKFLFAWYDLWVGFYYDRHRAHLYFMPIPMFGIIIKFPQRRVYIKSGFENVGIMGSTINRPEDIEHELKQSPKATFIPYLAWNGEFGRIWGEELHPED